MRSPRSSRGLAVFGSALLLSASAIVTSARLSVPDPNEVATADDVFQRVMSPFCPGLTLAECPSGQSVELRTRIEKKVESGATNREIDRWLTDQYGDAVLGSSRRAASWGPPLVWMLAAAALLLVYVRKSTARSRAQSPEGESPNQQQKTVLEAELRRFAKGTE